VLGYSTVEAGAAILPGRRLHGARRAALGQARRGAGRAFTLLLGYVFVLLGFLTMLLLWGRDPAISSSASATPWWASGVGFAGTPRRAP
jgi:hypothetical protein